MLQRQGYRNIKRLFLFAILLLVVLGANDSGYANEKWILWHGVENLGGVTVLNEDGHNLVPIDHVATMLKLEVDSDATSTNLISDLLYPCLASSDILSPANCIAAINSSRGNP